MNFAPGLLSIPSGNTITRYPPGFRKRIAVSMNSRSAGIAERVFVRSQDGNSYCPNTCESSIFASPPNGGLVNTISSFPNGTDRLASSLHSPGDCTELTRYTFDDPSPWRTRFIWQVRTRNGLISKPKRFRLQTSLTRRRARSSGAARPPLLDSCLSSRSYRLFSHETRKPPVPQQQSNTRKDVSRSSS